MLVPREVKRMSTITMLWLRFTRARDPEKRPQRDSRQQAGGAIPRTAIKRAFCKGGHKARVCTTYADTRILDLKL